MSDFADTRLGLSVVEIKDVTAAQRKAMFRLLQSCYANVSERQFNRDLDDKDWVALGMDTRSHEAWGFSTMKRMRATIGTEQIVAFYSGDTASRPDARGAESAAGISMVVRRMFYEAATKGSNADRIYWFTITSTFKSYRLLPMIFLDYAPSIERGMSPEETRIVTELSRIKGLDFNPQTGIVRLENPSIPRGLSREAEAAAERDPYVRFFLSANPNADKGDRLASLVELSPTNLTPLGARMIALEREQVAG